MEITNQHMQKCSQELARPIANSIMPQGNSWRISQLPEITTELKEQARHTMQSIQQKLSPADVNACKVAVASLMAHYYTADMPEQLYKMIGEDWILCLKEFPEWAIKEARIEWIKNNSKKAYPNDIRKLCFKAVSKDRAVLMVCERILSAPLDNPKPSPEMKKKVFQELEKAKQSLKRMPASMNLKSEEETLKEMQKNA